jgi:hypothetical protein
VIVMSRNATGTPMKNLFPLLLTLSLSTITFVTARAQGDCGTALDRATELYESAGFEEAIAVLRPCLAAGLVDEEKWQGYRLLALSYLFLNDPVSADTAIRMLLEINPRYQPNPGRDPIELIRPLQSYGSFPRFFAGPKAGIGLADRQITARRAVSGNRNLVRTASMIPGIDAGVMFDLNLNSDLSIATEMLYSTRMVGYTAEPQITLRTRYTERATWLTIPLFLRYQFDLGGVRPFLY